MNVEITQALMDRLTEQAKGDGDKQSDGGAKGCGKGYRQRNGAGGGARHVAGGGDHYHRPKRGGRHAEAGEGDRPHKVKKPRCPAGHQEPADGGTGLGEHRARQRGRGGQKDRAIGLYGQWR